MVTEIHAIYSTLVITNSEQTESFRQFKTNEIIFINQFQSTQTVTDQTNHSYSFNTKTIFYVDSEINKIVFKSKTNRVVFSNQ
jgi:hypothetical protein